MARADKGIAFMNDIERLTGVLKGVAQELDNLAETLEAGDTELEDVNGGTMEGEIAEGDALAAEIAAPVVRALDSISVILNKATAELRDDCKEAEI
jgi:hypothetical protein